MIKATCTKCGNTFDFDPAPQLLPENEIVKFSNAAPRSWYVLVVCPKCGHRKSVEIGE